MGRTSKKGRMASSSGGTLEKNVIATLMSKGFEVVSYNKWKANPKDFSTELLLKNIPYTTIYEKNGVTEFLLKSLKHNLEIRIECKWQHSSGSVDEKFPYLYLNCIEKMPESQIIIIVDGGGAKPEAVKWLKDVCRNKRYTTPANAKKNIEVMSLVEFIAWANKTFR